jgi:hypothetical protein
LVGCFVSPSIKWKLWHEHGITYIAWCQKYFYVSFEILMFWLYVIGIILPFKINAFVLKSLCTRIATLVLLCTTNIHIKTTPLDVSRLLCLRSLIIFFLIISCSVINRKNYMEWNWILFIRKSLLVNLVYLTLRSVSSLNNPQHNKMKFCENMKLTFWKSS